MWRTTGRAGGALALALCALSAASAEGPADGSGRRLEPLRRYRAEEARQAVAVDAEHFYAIDARRIGKYAKRTGERGARWAEREGGGIDNLNCGDDRDGRLHCAHSNYPAIPMRSSIESFDAHTLAHLESRDLGLLPGSATWVDRREGLFFVGLANYTGRGGAPGRGPEHSAVARFDAGWRPLASLHFPEALVRRFGTRSNSGGAFGPEGLLYATGHDAAELYLLRVPQAGQALELVEILPAPASGQGIAWDPAEPNLLWTIRRDTREVIASRLLGGAPPR
jgi:hypothetical protein